MPVRETNPKQGRRRTINTKKAVVMVFRATLSLGSYQDKLSLGSSYLFLYLISLSFISSLPFILSLFLSYLLLRSFSHLRQVPGPALNWWSVRRSHVVYKGLWCGIKNLRFCLLFFPPFHCRQPNSPCPSVPSSLGNLSSSLLLPPPVCPISEPLCLFVWWCSR